MLLPRLARQMGHHQSRLGEGGGMAGRRRVAAPAVLILAASPMLAFTTAALASASGTALSRSVSQPQGRSTAPLLGRRFRCSRTTAGP